MCVWGYPKWNGSYTTRRKMEKEFSEKLLVKADQEAEFEVVSLREKVWEENKKMWIVAGPAIFTRFSTFGINVVSQAFIGHIGSTELAAYSLVFTVLLRFANGVLLGMASALETLCGQAYGAKQYHMLGVYLQRSWVVLTICGFFLLPLFIFTAPILKALGQEAYIAEVAGNISLWLIPVMFSYIATFTCQMFLQAQSKNMFIAYMAAISFGMHVLLSWLFTVKYKFGIPGAMASTIMAYWLPNLGQLMFVTSGCCGQTWKGFTFLAFKDLWPVVKLSLSSGAMVCLEVWYNTVLLLLTGNMKNAEVAIDALAICLNVNGWELTIALGFLAAASVRVANELGRGSSKAARFSIIMNVVTSLIIGFVLFLLFLLLRGNLAYLFTESSEVAKAVGDLSPLLSFSILLNSIQPVLSGVAVGAGWQSIVAYINITCYYLIGIPVGLFLGYVVGMQVQGVWIGMLIGVFFQTLALCIITYKSDWDKQVIITRNRINKWFVADFEEQGAEAV